LNINVVGSSGSGKSPLAQPLATLLTRPYIELDALFWQPDWTPCPAPEFLARVERALSDPGWVLDGNYDRTRDIKWATVDVVIWLDLPVWRILCQVFARTLRRSLQREVLWAGNRETLRKALFSRDSILLWAITSLRPIRRRYRDVMADPRWQHIVFVQVQTQADLAALRTDPLAFLQAASRRTKQ
jgi:adenylate kinase family enzyme